MTPLALADLHKAAFVHERPWSAAEFQSLLENRLVRLFPDPNGFALCHTVAGETELLTLAVDPAHQRQGIGQRLTRMWLEAATNTAETAFLEVAADNDPAFRLYTSFGFLEVAKRASYYARKNAPAADAIVMRRDLT